jgi:hypothetical protein
MFTLALTLAASLALTTLSGYALVHYVRKEMAHARTALAKARKEFGA